ncbi:MAG: hypothetical protein LC731_05655, partial [Acidobacteria bacterium]|nr:hypothetical protein [Acidobacteriota bacterium]
VVIAMCGLGGTLFFYLMSMKEPDSLFLVMLGVTAFLIGLGIVINGLLFTIPKGQSSSRSLDVVKEEIERSFKSANTREELPPAREMGVPVSSVTEHTTHRLPQEAAQEPKAGPPNQSGNEILFRGGFER